MVKEYDTYVKDKSSLSLDTEVELVIRDLTPGPRKYEARVVKAKATKNITAKGDKLWLRYPTGSQDPDPMGFKIVKELGEGPR